MSGLSCVHVVIMSPKSSKPSSQLKVAVSPLLFPVRVTPPLVGVSGLGHMAEKLHGQSLWGISGGNLSPKTHSSSLCAHNFKLPLLHASTPTPIKLLNF